VGSRPQAEAAGQAEDGVEALSWHAIRLIGMTTMYHNNRQRSKAKPRSNSGKLIGAMGLIAATIAIILANLPAPKEPDIANAIKQMKIPQSDRIAGVARVVDGDTVKIGETRIRFFGIDAPEHDQTCRDAQGRDWDCGVKAADALRARIGDRPLSCTPRDTDRYGRTVAVCRLDGVDLNAWMVTGGWAVAYRYFSLDYVGAENQAHAAHRGIWIGTFENPYDWRKAHPRG
jgi:endonuclease YncB( thermonuclease family)